MQIATEPNPLIAIWGRLAAARTDGRSAFPPGHGLPIAVLLTIVIGLTTLIPASVLAAEAIDFQRDVRPILSDHCFACHGPDVNERKADLRLDEPSDDMQERQIVVPQRPDESELLRRVQAEDPDERMPPPEFGKQLTADQVEQLRRWIDQGAAWRGHWAFEPPRRAPLPGVRQVAWPRGELDFFVLARIEDAGLQPTPRADRRTLLRRLCLDLTGLPPTRDQLTEFLADGDPDAYERWVDRLLESPAFGERMALAWMDQARYADTNGYSIDGGRQMWLWRDWVIDAYNRNLPFDQFVVDQLAGDLLPGATADQRLATGFHRNHMITHEGGTIPEENLTNYVADRVKTTGEVFLGLTLGCAQCHDHKFDPITQRDYYRLFAYFNTLGDRGLDGDGGRNATPKIAARSIFGRDDRMMAEHRAELAELRAQLEHHPLTGQAKWEQQTRLELERRGADLQLHPVEVLKVTSPNRGAEYDVRADGTVFIPSASGRSPSISAKIDADNVTALRLVFTPHENFPQGGLGHGNPSGLPGSFLLTGFSASATALPSDQVDLYRTLAFKTATASAAHPDFPPVNCLDERDHNGWSPHPHNQQAQHITFQLAEPLHASETPYVTVMLVWGGGPFGGGAALIGGQYRLFAVTGHDDGTNLPDEVQTILRTVDAERSAAQAERLKTYYASVADETANLRYRIANLEQRIRDLTEPQEVMVMDVADSPRKTFVLNRGQYDQPTEEVTAGTPAHLVPPDRALPPNRLGLAQWLVQPDHPLTARVAVNRLWQLMFGTGLVSTSADFGSQGSPPTHPELLDFLAIEFVESGWDVKAMLKRIVMSATYQQGSQVSPEAARVDPGNQLLSHGARFRLPAELVRDNALQISGLLVQRIGGPSVLPYQPPGLWKEISHYGSTPATSQVFVQDHGDRLYRRSLYTYWKRTAPPPSMISFDAPNREICAVQRSTTNTPLQALVLLNDPQFVEAGRVFAARILREAGSEMDERLRFAFETATARLPSERELRVLRRTLARERARFAADPAAAEARLQVGESDRDPQLDPVEHAAWTSVAILILNLSETITRG